MFLSKMAMPTAGFQDGGDELFVTPLKLTCDIPPTLRTTNLHKSVSFLFFFLFWLSFAELFPDNIFCRDKKRQESVSMWQCGKPGKVLAILFLFKEISGFTSGIQPVK